jgi:hypothetical protein
MRRRNFPFGPTPILWRKGDTPKPGLWIYKLDAQFGFFARHSFLVHHAALRYRTGLCISQPDGRFDLGCSRYSQEGAMSAYNARARVLSKTLPIDALAGDFHGHVDCYPQTPACDGSLGSSLSGWASFHCGQKARIGFPHKV